MKFSIDATPAEVAELYSRLVTEELELNLNGDDCDCACEDDKDDTEPRTFSFTVDPSKDKELVDAIKKTFNLK